MLAAAAAARGAVTTLPVSGTPNKTGLTLQIESDWVDSDGGYRPVTVTVKCVPPPLGDRTLKIALRSDGYRQGSYAVSQDLELPAGAASASIVIPVPQFGRGMFLSVVTAENGQTIDDLSAQWLATSSRPQSTGEPQLLHISENPATSDLDAFYRQPSTPGSGTVIQSDAIGRKLADVPNEWVDLSALDFIALSADELELMARTAPRTWQAVRDWTAAGGNLCIYDVGGNFEQLGAIDELLGDRPPLAGRESTGPLEPWIDCDPALLPELDAAGFPVVAGDDEADLDPMAAAEPVASTPAILAAIKRIAARVQTEGERPFRSRAFALGRVVALKASVPFPAATDPARSEMLSQWLWVRATVGADRSNWIRRHGVVFEGANPDFWNLLIPGVGLPPVNTYRVLISLFVIVIGPVNYFLLRRLRRLHYLLFIVPASAALVTLALLGYALMSDGLSTRLRARSYTLVDQRSGRAVTWARLSYYAGLSPYGGLTFDRDTAVYPFSYETGRSSGGRLPLETKLGQLQHLEHGWLPARTPTQFLAVRSAAQRKRLKITPREKGIEVTNELGMDVAQLVVVDPSGRMYHLFRLAAGQQALAEPLAAAPADGASAALPTPLVAALMKRPAGELVVQPGNSTSFFGMNRSAYYMPGRTATGGSSLLEQRLKQFERAGMGPAVLGPGSYLAIVERADPAILGVAEAVEDNSLHVVEGRW